jgi:hypothetical protein
MQGCAQPRQGLPLDNPVQAKRSAGDENSKLNRMQYNLSAPSYHAERDTLRMISAPFLFDLLLSLFLFVYLSVIYTILFPRRKKTFMFFLPPFHYGEGLGGEEKAPNSVLSSPQKRNKQMIHLFTDDSLAGAPVEHKTQPVSKMDLRKCRTKKRLPFFPPFILNRAEHALPALCFTVHPHQVRLNRRSRTLFVQNWQTA